MLTRSIQLWLVKQKANPRQTWHKERPMRVSRYEETHLGDISHNALLTVAAF